MPHSMTKYFFIPDLRKVIESMKEYHTTVEVVRIYTTPWVTMWTDEWHFVLN